jgi:uncharacterized RDD family membrane protein YckC
MDNPAKPPPVDLSNAAVPGLLRRIAALFYDSLLLAGVLMLASALVTLINAGEPVPSGPLMWLFQLYLLAVIYLYFAWHWTHGGQTLGMRAWRLRLLRCDGHNLQQTDGLKRFVAAVLSLLPMGLGLLWCLVDPDGLAWHDRLSATRLVLEAQKK